MDIIEHLTKLKDVSFKQRDLLIDDLSDLFESGQISESRANMTIAAVIQLLETETDIDFLESVFNLLELAFESGFCQTLIVSTTVKYLPALEVGSLCHAFTIVDESNLPNKKELLLTYLASENRIIKELAREQLLFC